MKCFSVQTETGSLRGWDKISSKHQTAIRQFHRLVISVFRCVYVAMSADSPAVNQISDGAINQS